MFPYNQVKEETVRSPSYLGVGGNCNRLDEKKLSFPFGC